VIRYDGVTLMLQTDGRWADPSGFYHAINQIQSGAAPVEIVFEV
jgi:hypothetical protein